MTSNSENFVAYEESNGVAWVTLNRPEKLNSLTGSMLSDLRTKVIHAGSSETVRAMVLSGSGRAFCAGQDLAEVDGVDLGDVLERDYNPLIRSIKSLNLPVIACVNGVAAGAGANLALSADIVLAGRSARFIQSFAQLGLVPDAGGSWSLPKLVGLPRALGLAMTAEPVSAEQAEQWGMIWRCCDDNDLIEETNQLATKLAAMPTTGLAYTKRLLNDSGLNTLDEQLNLERDYQRAACATDDYKEGLDAFLNKRQPKFTGR